MHLLVPLPCFLIFPPTFCQLHFKKHDAPRGKVTGCPKRKYGSVWVDGCLEGLFSVPLRHREGAMKRTRKMGIVSTMIWAAVLATVSVWTTAAWAERPKEKTWQAWELRKRVTQDRICGLPESILQQQRLTRVSVPALDEAISEVLRTADQTAAPLIDQQYHTGRQLVVPDTFTTIQSAIDAASPRDVVIVKSGTYFELIVMKDGVKLVSDDANGGNELVTVENAYLHMPRRTLRTVIDGSKATASNRGMIDFNEDVGRKTIVDGFTIQNLPVQDHHVPGHAHAINARGASPVLMNCYVRNNGSTGIGSHVVFKDQDQKVGGRGFRWQNVRKRSEGIIYRNILQGNLGLGIGCNHFSAPLVLGNEVLANNDAELGHDPSPGIGVKHGAAPTLIGNIVHDNPGGGILCQIGVPQGTHNIDRPTHPTLSRNVVFRNGKSRPAIAARGAGSKETPVMFIGNYIFDAGSVGIGLNNGAVGIVEKNLVSGSNAPGVEINNAVVLRLNSNQITGANGPGILITNGAEVLEMKDNAADGNRGPRFMLRGARIAGPNG